MYIDGLWRHVEPSFGSGAAFVRRAYVQLHDVKLQYGINEIANNERTLECEDHESVSSCIVAHAWPYQIHKLKVTLAAWVTVTQKKCYFSNSLCPAALWLISLTLLSFYNFFYIELFLFLCTHHAFSHPAPRSYTGVLRIRLKRKRTYYLSYHAETTLTACSHFFRILLSFISATFGGTPGFQPEVRCFQQHLRGYELYPREAAACAMHTRSE